MIAQVLVELRAKKLDKTFSYVIPKHLKVQVGMRVVVPFNNRKLEGFVLKIDDNIETDYQLKEIIDTIDDEPILNEEMLKLGNHISSKTLSSKISCYQTMLPSALKAKHNFVINKKYVTYLKVNENIDTSLILKTPKQKQIYTLVKNNPRILKKEVTNISASIVKKLITEQVLIEIKEETYRINNECLEVEKDLILNEEQTKALQQIINSINTFKPFLLYGITGSGKTEVYIHAIKEVMAYKKSIVVLVPEISLTPQFINRFQKRFGDNIAILHSGLSDGEKYDEWRKIKNGDVQIVIGARSAIFAPFTNIGLIIIDEEHSSTYKQENTPKYDTIDIALTRCKYHNCPLILGSATPSIESYTRASLNIYTLLSLKKRVNDCVPKVKLIDMKAEIRKRNPIISSLLRDSLDNVIKSNEQAIILLNRRGYTTVISCKECGYVQKCPKCDIPLTYHKKNNIMQCHYCGYNTYKFIKCPSCASNKINEFGLGTEKLEQIIKEEFSGAKVIRMDVDTTRKKGSYQKIITAFEEKKYNVLIGTQMIAKGLDFDDVTLVGVINGDSSLNIPDYKSAERTFQLLNQVSGRAGRKDKKGLVIIQGFNIDHYSIITASNNDYTSFYNTEVTIRKKLNYPPYCNLVLFKIESSSYENAILEADKIVHYLRQNKYIKVLGPSSASIPKINNIYIVQIIVKYKKIQDIYDYLLFIKQKYIDIKSVNVEIDLNPSHI